MLNFNRQNNNKIFVNSLFLLCLSLMIISCGTGTPGNVDINNGIELDPIKLEKAPQDIQVTEYEGKIYLSWSSDQDATHYKLYLSSEPSANLDIINSDITTIFESINDTKWTLEGISSNKAYYIVLASVKINGEEVRSEEKIISLLLSEINIYLNPLDNFTALEKQGVIELNWNALPEALNYVIYYSSTDSQVTPNEASQIKEIGAPPFIHKNLIQDKTYYYRISAVTTDGLTSPSEVKNVKLGIFSTPPTVPQRFSATAGDGLVALKWAPVINASSYTVYMANESIINVDNVKQLDGGEELSNITNVSTNRLQLENDTTYYFRVVSVNEDRMRSSASPELAATPKSILPTTLVPAPSSISAKSIDNGISLSWSKVIDANTYTVYWSTTPDADEHSATPVPDIIDNQYLHENLNSPDILYFFVTATIENEESNNSAMVSAAPFVAPEPPPAPENITLVQTTNGLKIQWDPLNDAEEYVLYLATEPGINKENYFQLQDGIRLRFITNTFFVKTSLLPGREYYTRVSAINAGGEGALSPEISLRTSKPLITLLGDNPFTLYQGETFSDPGVTASEVEYGDLSTHVISESTVDTNTPGTYIIKYNVTDSNNIPAPEQQRTVNVLFNNPPVLSLAGDNPASLILNQPFDDSGATATDTEDGDLSQSISVTGTIDNTQTRSYTLTYSVKDSMGKTTSKIRTVIVSSLEQPVITLTGDNPLTLFVGEAYIESGANAVDSVDADITDQISINTSAIDTNTEGSYQVTYNVSDSAGNAAITVTRDIIVYDFNISISTLDFLALNQSHNLTATLTYTAGQQDITELAEWSTINSDIMSLSNTVDSKGQISAMSVGTAVIDVDYKGRNVSSTIKVINIPDPPLGLRATDSGFNSIQLQWRGSDDATSYSIYRKENGYGFTLLSSTPIPFTTLTDFDVEPGTTYSYYVVANNIHVSSKESNHVSLMLSNPAVNN
ncbi:MAG: DUF5011 domain-containing protein [Proteobacteria bacterium]|nr:DUF5011 domain-containing protein [Pseudomonadota bacterium]